MYERETFYAFGLWLCCLLCIFAEKILRCVLLSVRMSILPALIRGTLDKFRHCLPTSIVEWYRLVIVNVVRRTANTQHLDSFTLLIYHNFAECVKEVTCTLFSKDLSPHWPLDIHLDCALSLRERLHMVVAWLGSFRLMRSLGLHAVGLWRVRYSMMC